MKTSISIVSQVFQIVARTQIIDRIVFTSSCNKWLRNTALNWIALSKNEEFVHIVRTVVALVFRIVVVQRWSLETNIVRISGRIKHFCTRWIVDERRHLFKSQYFKRMDKNLLSPWTKVLSKQRLLYYWFNSKTGKTQWEEELSLNESEYVEHFLTWICGVILTMYTKTRSSSHTSNTEKLFCVLNDNTMFPDLKCSMTDVFKEIQLPSQIFSACSLSSHPNSHTVSPNVHSLFDCFLPLDRAKKVDHMYIQFLVNEKFETEYTTRAFFSFLYTSVNKNGIVWGLTLNPEFIQNIKTGTDPYHRLWKNSHAKYKSQQKHVWSNDTHAISLGTNSDFIWRYGNTNKSRGWIMSPHIFKQYCVDYKFEVLTYSSVVDFYYKYANDFMPEFKQLVGYRLSCDTDWNSINMYDVFILQRM